MKNIELTKEHKSKLLEMCNKLFSSEGIFFTVNCGDIYYSKNGMYPGKSIHWFEFCMTHLAKKLIPKVTNYNLDSAYDSLYNVIYQFWENKHTHIVDYLYEEFKKLK